MTKKIVRIFLLAAVLVQLVASCHINQRETPRTGKDTNTFPDYLEQPKQKVMIFISAGFNNLSTYLKEDIQDMMKGYLPAKNGTEALFVIAKHTNGNLTIPTSPCLIRLYRNVTGIAVADTVYKMEPGTILANPVTVKTFLRYIQENYPSPHYGLVISSHGNGWLPSGYYDNPGGFDGSIRRSVRRVAGSPFFEFEEPDRPLTKTLLQETYYESSKKLSTEVEVADLAAAIPMHLDYFLIDACLMGCVEVAYAFKDKADVIGFSQAEVMADGFDYAKLASRLLEEPEPNSIAVCSDFLEQYLDPNVSMPSATISLVSSAALPALASVCKELISEYRTEIEALNWNEVQNFGGTKHWFFDLEDIFVKAGLPEDKLKTLSAALDDCVLYKGDTGQYYSVTNSMLNDIDAFCGLTMFLPQGGSEYLKDKYQLLDWNKDTQLINN